MIQRGLLWNDDSSGELVPTWTELPNISIVLDLAVQHLPQTFTDIAVEFFAEGAFNKLYSICSPHHPQHYIMRITLPVEPFFKTESECATLAYIRNYTSIPVPNVIAYDSSSENRLGFEWMIIEKIEGVPLSDVWEKMDFDSKVRLTLEASNLLQQQHDLNFSQAGNLYFAAVATKVNNKIESSSDAETLGGRCASDGTLKVDRGIGADFVIGRMVSPWFFRDKRVLLPADRGPFSSSHDLMMAKTQIQIERVSNLSPSPTDEFYSEMDEELAEDQKEVLETCHNLKALIPKIFPPSPNGRKEINILHHPDLSDRNIIVHPTSYRINGIVDWESVSICPAWQASEYPYFLRGINTPEPPPVGAPGVDEEDLIEIRKDWEKVLLRGLYLQSLQDAAKGLNGVPLLCKAESDLEIKRKQKFEDLLQKIEDRWTVAKHWIPKLLSMDIDALGPL